MKHNPADKATDPPGAIDADFDDPPQYQATFRAFSADDHRESAARPFNDKKWLGSESPLALGEIIELGAALLLKESIELAPRMAAFYDRPPMNGLTLGDAVELALRFTRKRQRGRPPKEHRNLFVGDFFHPYWRSFGERFSKKEISFGRMFLVPRFDETSHVPKRRICRNCHEPFDTRWPAQTECSLRCAEQMLGINHTEENRAAWLLAIKARAIAERRKREPAPDSLAPVSRIVVWRAAEMHA